MVPLISIRFLQRPSIAGCSSYIRVFHHYFILPETSKVMYLVMLKPPLLGISHRYTPVGD